jgi:DNA ligase D-like protein (predicted ligase)
VTAAGPLDRLSAAERALLRPAPADRVAQAVPPMLATLSDRRTFDERWLFERKLDGVRLLAVRDGAGRTGGGSRSDGSGDGSRAGAGARAGGGSEAAGGGGRLLSRTGKDAGVTYPEVAAALATQECPDFTVDGEVVAFRDGRTDFSLLQQRMGLTRPRAVAASPVAVFYYVFDLLVLDGYDTTRLPQRTRKSLLRSALTFGGPLRFTPHRNQARLDEACARGWEGLIAKRADAPYAARRSPDWLKLKCARGQEFVIGGFTEPAGSRTGFGALLLGYYDHDEGRGAGRRLRYAGKAGTGYSDRVLASLRARLDELAVPRSPFADPVRERTAHWTRPELVAEIAFTEWTRDGMLRHPRFLGLREDKLPADVTREAP